MSSPSSCLKPVPPAVSEIHLFLQHHYFSLSTHSFAPPYKQAVISPILKHKNEKKIIFTPVPIYHLLFSSSLNQNFWGKKAVYIYLSLDFPVALMVNNLPANTGDVKRCGFNPWVEKIRWRRAWQPTPVFLPGESHGQKSLAGHSPWSHKESDTD